MGKPRGSLPNELFVTLNGRRQLWRAVDEDSDVFVHGSPQVLLATVFRDEQLIEMSRVSEAPAALPEPSSIRSAFVVWGEREVFTKKFEILLVFHRHATWCKKPP